MLEVLQYQFFQNALLAALFASIASGFIGTYIVARRMSLISGSIAHTAFGGLGISYFAGFHPLVGAIIFSVSAAISIAWFRQRAAARLDTLLSFLWATGMAIGLVFIFLTPGYTTDLFSYLFGNILLVSQIDLLMILLMNVIIVGSVILFYNAFLSVSFDEEYARARSLPVTLINMILFALIALTIVATIRVVGIVLMIALLTIPPATAQLFHKKISRIMITSILLTLGGSVGGLFLAYTLNFATGPIIVLILSAIYLGSSLIMQFARPYNR